MLKLKYYLYNHYNNFIMALGNLSKTPFASATSIIIIGFALSLPTSFYLAISNLKNLIHVTDTNPQLSIYFKEDNKETIINNYKNNTVASKFEYYPPHENIQVLEEYLDTKDLHSLISEQQLPAKIIFYLKNNVNNNEASNFLNLLKKEPLIEHAELDMIWLEKWQALLHLLEKISFILSVALAIGAAFIIANITNLAIENNKHAIKILDFIGASGPYIRREYLYLGFFRGFLGSLMATLMVFGIIMNIKPNFNVFFADLLPDTIMIGFDYNAVILLIIIGSSIGIISSWLAFEFKYHDLKANC